jgi:hypothetical protein
VPFALVVVPVQVTVVLSTGAAGVQAACACPNAAQEASNNPGISARCDEPGLGTFRFIVLLTFIVSFTFIGRAGSIRDPHALDRDETLEAKRTKPRPPLDLVFGEWISGECRWR